MKKLFKFVRDQQASINCGDNAVEKVVGKGF